VPDYFVMTYAVCGCSKDACGWGGWMIEAAFKRTEKKDWPTYTGDKLLNAFDLQLCPRCGRETFRTGASVIVENPRPFGEEPEEGDGGTVVEFEDEPGKENESGKE
jgi:hypothetical protein